MKPAIQLTFALLFPLATACVAQTGASEDVNATDQGMTETSQAAVQPGNAKVEPRAKFAHQFTTTTATDMPVREMSADEQDPTTSKKVDGVDPVPVPWDPARVTKR